MKLSEVIKAIEDGSKSTFEIGERKIKTNCHGDLYATFEGNVTSYLPLDGWEEVKLHRQWSGDELKIIKIFEWAKWITKTKKGDVIITEEKPVMDIDDFAIIGGKMVIINKETVERENGFNSTVTLEESPVYIGDLKGE